MANQTRRRADTQRLPDTSLDMLKRVFAVAELVVKSKQFQENTPRPLEDEDTPKKHIS